MNDVPQLGDGKFFAHYDRALEYFGDPATAYNVAIRDCAADDEPVYCYHPQEACVAVEDQGYRPNHRPGVCRSCGASVKLYHYLTTRSGTIIEFNPPKWIGDRVLISEARARDDE